MSKLEKVSQVIGEAGSIQHDDRDRQGQGGFGAPTRSQQVIAWARGNAGRGLQREGIVRCHRSVGDPAWYRNPRPVTAPRRGPSKRPYSPPRRPRSLPPSQPMGSNPSLSQGLRAVARSPPRIRCSLLVVTAAARTHLQPPARTPCARLVPHPSVVQSARQQDTAARNARRCTGHSTRQRAAHSARVRNCAGSSQTTPNTIEPCAISRLTSSPRMKNDIAWA